MKIAVIAVIVVGMAAAGLGGPVAPFGLLAVIWGTIRYRKMSIPPLSWWRLIPAMVVLFVAVGFAVEAAIQLVFR